MLGVTILTSLGDDEIKLVRKKLKWNDSILNSISLESSNLPELKSYDFSLQGLSDRYNKRWKNLSYQKSL